MARRKLWEEQTASLAREHTAPLASQPRPASTVGEGENSALPTEAPVAEVSAACSLPPARTTAAETQHRENVAHWNTMRMQLDMPKSVSGRKHDVAPPPQSDMSPPRSKRAPWAGTGQRVPPPSPELFNTPVSKETKRAVAAHCLQNKRHGESLNRSISRHGYRPLFPVDIE